MRREPVYTPTGWNGGQVMDELRAARLMAHWRRGLWTAVALGALALVLVNVAA